MNITKQIGNTRSTADLLRQSTEASWQVAYERIRNQCFERASLGYYGISQVTVRPQQAATLKAEFLRDGLVVSDREPLDDFATFDLSW